MKTKLFEGHYTAEKRWVSVDEEINSFLQENKGEVLDIKFSSCMNNDDLVHSALLLYKEETA
jgi:hypothetical protein